MIDTGVLELFYELRPLSVQQSMQLLIFRTGISIDAYQIYRSLMNEGHVVVKSASTNPEFAFDMYSVERRKSFKKTNPGPPDFRLIIRSVEESPLSPIQAKHLIESSEGVPVRCAVFMYGGYSLVAVEEPQTNLLEIDVGHLNQMQTKLI